MDFSFLDECLRSGLLEYWSAVSVHPYLRSDPEMVVGDYCRLRELMKTYAPLTTRRTSDGIILIISSEWGYSRSGQASEEKQSQLLARQWLTNVANSVSLSIWYDWRDDGPDANDPEHQFGMVSNLYHEGHEPVYDPKPAYFAARTLAMFFGGYRFDKRLDIGSAEDYVLVFRNGIDLRLAAWTTLNPHEVLIPLNTADQKGLIITLTAAPIYLR
jgi:polysaccharide biosynthesis protein PslG